MRQLVLALDALPSLRDAIDAEDVDVAAATMLSELAGVDAIRLGVNEDLKPVREEDVQEARRAARVLELRMPPSSSLLKVALEGRPDRVVLAAEGSGRKGPAGPVDLRGRSGPIEPVVRALGEAGIATVAVVSSDLESVKLAHGHGVAGVEFYTGATVDLPPAERRGELERLATRCAWLRSCGSTSGWAVGSATARWPRCWTPLPRSSPSRSAEQRWRAPSWWGSTGRFAT